MARCTEQMFSSAL